jgi:excinuclease UvrABC nuclease subunit
MNVNLTIRKIEKRIFMKSNRIKYTPSTEWFKEIPSEAGVYAFFKNDKIIYIGETGSLRSRIKDSTRTVNHTLRRTIGKRRYKNIKGYLEATSYKRFPDHIETKINKYMNSIYIVFIPVSFGRSEIEEYIVDRYRPIYNNKSKRESV